MRVERMDDLSNDDLTEEFVDVEQLQEDFSFTQRLANYYSDFLSTDFKKEACQSGVSNS